MTSWELLILDSEYNQLESSQ